MTESKQHASRLTPIKSGLAVSFEFFPPKTPAMEETLWRSIERLAPIGPRFVSVTYGAGGGTRERTHATVKRVLTETTLTPAAHLTCVDATRDQVDAVARRYHQAGVRHIVALRGDPPDGKSRFTPHPDGYDSAAHLVAGLKRVADFELTVGAYPEVHPDARSAEHDLDNLKRKLDAGASRAITQFFFDTDRTSPRCSDLPPPAGRRCPPGWQSCSRIWTMRRIRASWWRPRLPRSSACDSSARG
jgi:methylenetetrahydrofolate reductase (NADPH)